jgi:UTP--glucose-1-phosphate uridylyltransferase
MIRNQKTIDPRDPTSTPVYQLETAMGSAIAVFAGAEAIRVPRSRFAPVKKTDDLLAVRSDAYALLPDYRVELASERHGMPPAVELKGDHYRFVSDLDDHFPFGAPSLRYCDNLIVEGEFEFGRDITLCGNVHFRNKNGKCHRVPDGLVVENSLWPAPTGHEEPYVE